MKNGLIPSKIIERMDKAGRGSVFTHSDFYDLGDEEAVRKAILRLAEEGVVERVLRGLYLYPKYSDLLNRNIPANPDEIAKALARNYHWTITPSGALALNQLGLSTQVPMVYEYLSDGAYKKYQYGKFTITFKHRTNREMSGISYKSRLVIQALKSLGKEHIDDEILSRLARVLTDDERECLVVETQNASNWIHRVAKRLVKGDYDATIRSAARE